MVQYIYPNTSIIPLSLIYTYIATVLLPCKDGYYGLNCRLHCPRPYFGEGCVLKCNCSEEHCHHVHGCQSFQGTQDMFNEYVYETSNVYTKKNHCFHYRVIEIREDTTLSLSYEYTPLVVDLTTSTQVYDKTGKLVF